MTEEQAKTKVVSISSAEVGYREGGNNWNKFAAEIDPLKITWGDKQNQPWCGEFVLFVFVTAFGVDAALSMLCSGNPTSIPLCSAGAQYFQDAGRWFRSPEEADVVFFYNGGGINHTGIVERVSGGRVYTIEGNSGDMVARRNYAIGDGYIAGYGRPRWDVVRDEPEDDEVIIDDQPSKPVPDEPDEPEQPDTPAEPEKPSDGKCTVTLPLLMIGDSGQYVKTAQTLLIARGYDCGNRPFVGVEKADGEFGRCTERAVGFFQSKSGLEVDGIIGGATWAALLKL